MKKIKAESIEPVQTNVEIEDAKFIGTFSASESDATFQNVTVNSLSTNGIVESDAQKKLISASKGTAYNKNFGTIADTVTEGNDSRLHTHSNKPQLDTINQDMANTNNVTFNGLQLNGLTASQILETDASKNLVTVAKNTAYNKNFGTIADTVTEGNDSRIHTHTNKPQLDTINQDMNVLDTVIFQGLKLNGLTASKIVETDVQSLLTSVDKNTAYNKNFGTVAGTVAEGSDSRFHDHTNKVQLDTINQNMANTDNVTFNNLKLNGLTSDTVVRTNTAKDLISAANSAFLINIDQNLRTTDTVTHTNVNTTQLRIGNNNVGTVPVYIDALATGEKISFYNTDGTQKYGIDMQSGAMELVAPSSAFIRMRLGNTGSLVTKLAVANTYVQIVDKLLLGTGGQNSPINVYPSATGEKIALYDFGAFYGLGVSGGQLNVVSPASIVFYNGGRNNDGTEISRISSTGLRLTNLAANNYPYINASKDLIVASNSVNLASVTQNLSSTSDVTFRSMILNSPSTLDAESTLTIQQTQNNHLINLYLKPNYTGTVLNGFRFFSAYGDDTSTNGRLAGQLQVMQWVQESLSYQSMLSFLSYRIEIGNKPLRITNLAASSYPYLNASKDLVVASNSINLASIDQDLGTTSNVTHGKLNINTAANGEAIVLQQNNGSASNMIWTKINYSADPPYVFNGFRFEGTPGDDVSFRQNGTMYFRQYMYQGVTPGWYDRITLKSNGTVSITNTSASQIVETDVNGAITSVAKNTAYNKNFGTSSGTVAEGNDSRFPSSGEYDPSLSTPSNLATYQTYSGSFRYMKAGNNVQVSGLLKLKATAIDQWTHIDMSLPTSTEISPYYGIYINGTASGTETASPANKFNVGSVNGNGVSDLARLSYWSTSTADIDWTVNFMYRKS